MMKLGNETALQLNDCYYLDYIYKSLHVQCYNNDQLVKHIDYTISISSNYTNVQHIVMAICNYYLGLPKSTILTNLSRENLNAAGEIFRFSLKNRYFPWDIYSCPNISDLAKIVHTTGHFSRSPHVIKQDVETEKMQFNLRVLEPLENDDTSKEFKYEIMVSGLGISFMGIKEC